MASWITIATIVSAFSAAFLRFTAFAILCLSVSALFLIIGVATGSRISTAIAWTLLLIGGMQVGYLAGALGYSIVFQIIRKKGERLVI
jgi:hypothetical protein